MAALFVGFYFFFLSERSFCSSFYRSFCFYFLRHSRQNDFVKLTTLRRARRLKDIITHRSIHLAIFHYQVEREWERTLVPGRQECIQKVTRMTFLWPFHSVSRSLPWMRVMQFMGKVASSCSLDAVVKNWIATQCTAVRVCEFEREILTLFQLHLAALARVRPNLSRPNGGESELLMIFTFVLSQSFLSQASLFQLNFCSFTSSIANRPLVALVAQF